MARTFQTCTVQDLLDALEGQDPEALVCFASNYGDRGNTQQVHALDGNVEPEKLSATAYSDSGWAIAPDEDHDDTTDGPMVLVIS